MYNSFELELTVQTNGSECETFKGDKEGLELYNTFGKGMTLIWTICGRGKDGLANSILDFPYEKREDAERMFNFLNTLLSSRKKLENLTKSIEDNLLKYSTCSDLSSSLLVSVLGNLLDQREQV